MPDITMCAGSAQCPLAKSCYRAPESGTKPSEFRQAWSTFEPIQMPKDRWTSGEWMCLHYWRNPYQEMNRDQ